MGDSRRILVRAVLSVLGLVLGAGCASGIGAEMESWVGHPVADVIAAWGPPLQVIDGVDGGRVHTWVLSRSSAAPGSATTPGGAPADPARNGPFANYPRGHDPAEDWADEPHYNPTHTATSSSTRTFWVDVDGIIVRGAWRR